MGPKTSDFKISMHFTRSCLVVPLQVELSDSLILQVQDNVLKTVHKSGIKGVVIDLTAVNIIDSFIANKIFDTVKMVSLLGATTVLVGLKPGVIVSLLDLGVNIKDILVSRTLEDGFRVLKPIVGPEAPEDAEEEEEEEEVDDEAEDTEDEFDDETEEDETDEEEVDDETDGAAETDEHYTDDVEEDHNVYDGEEIHNTDDEA